MVTYKEYKILRKVKRAPIFKYTQLKQMSFYHFKRSKLILKFKIPDLKNNNKSISLY